MVINHHDVHIDIMYKLATVYLKEALRRNNVVAIVENI